MFFKNFFKNRKLFGQHCTNGEMFGNEKLFISSLSIFSERFIAKLNRCSLLKYEIFTCCLRHRLSFRGPLLPQVLSLLDAVMEGKATDSTASNPETQQATDDADHVNKLSDEENTADSRGPEKNNQKFKGFIER